MTLPQLISSIGERLPIVGGLFRKRKLYLHYSRFVPPGHFYSPVLSDEEIEKWINRKAPPGESGLDRRLEAQERLVESLSKFYSDIPFQDDPSEALRYYYRNAFYGYADAIFLSLLIRHLQPARIIEVGSGFSSAVMLDTAERFLSKRPIVTFIEPFADRLKSLLRHGDGAYCNIIETAVQEVGLDLFTSLESNDILFIDSSHVNKAGSDVNFLLFEVLPRLKSGVWIHIHDIAPDFDYSEKAIRDGVGWNEAYSVHAFLLFNDSFEVALHNPYIVGQRRDWFLNNMPACVKNAGSGLWLRRK